MHTGLGTVDDHAVVALGLPKSADGSKPEGVVPSSHQAEGAAKVAEVAAKAAEGEAQNFSMGVTLPTVPARLVKRILSGEFVDMGELSQDALWAEFRRSTEGEEKPSKAKSVRPVADRDAWAASFAQYAESLQRPTPPVPGPLAPQRQRKRRVQACFTWNDGRPCAHNKVPHKIATECPWTTIS